MMSKWCYLFLASVVIVVIVFLVGGLMSVAGRASRREEEIEGNMAEEEFRRSSEKEGE